MGVSFVDAIVIHAADLEATVAFYQAIGLPLASESHGEGPEHYACELGGAHFAVYPAKTGGRAPGRRDAGGTLLGLRVADLEGSVDALRKVEARVIVEAESVPWGRRALVEDPDGRVIELNQSRE